MPDVPERQMRLLSPQTVAERLGVSSRTVRRMEDRGQLERVQVTIRCQRPKVPKLCATAMLKRTNNFTMRSSGCGCKYKKRRSHERFS